MFNPNIFCQTGIDVCNGYTAVSRVGTKTFIPRAAPPYLNSNGKFYGPGLVHLNYDAATITDPAAIAAISYVESIADQMLATSSNTVPITMKVRHSAIGSLGVCAPYPIFTSEFTSANPYYIPNSVYPKALANKIANYNINPAIAEADIAMLNSANWYYGTDGMLASNQYDYVSALFHEVCHGLGFAYFDYPVDSSSYGYSRNEFGISKYYISLFDRFSINNSSVLLTSLPSPSIAVKAYFQQPDNLASEGIYFNGPVAISQNNGIKPRMQKNKRAHLREFSYGYGDINSLMTPSLANYEVIHDLGPAGKGILKDLGWDITIATGINDRLYITPCYNNYIFTNSNPDCRPYATVLNEGGTYTYLAHFEDNAPYGATMTTRNWKIELYKSDGTMYTLYNETNANITTEKKSILVPLVPQITNNTWRRNDDGTIKAKITVSGYDNQGYYKSSSIIVGINKKPEKPMVNLYTNTCGKPWSTNSASISFYAPGATSYKVYVGTIHGVYNSTYNVPAGKYTYLVSSLAVGVYYISVKGFNGNDSSSIYGNELVVNTSCDVNSRIANNNVDMQQKILSKALTVLEGNNLFIKNIYSPTNCNLTVVNAIGQVIKYKEIPLNQQNVEIDVSDLADGLYFVNISNSESIIYNTKFVINSR